LLNVYYLLQHKCVYFIHTYTYLLNIDIDIDIAIFRQDLIDLASKSKKWY